MNTRWARCALAACLLVATRLQAGTQEDDEAQVAALIRAQLAVAPLAAPGAAVTMALAPAQSPAPVIAEVIAPQPVEPPSDDEWRAPTPSQDEGLSFAELAQYVGRPVTIVSGGGRVHRGTVSAANAREVTLRVRRAGGSATYTLQRNQILRIDPR